MDSRAPIRLPTRDVVRVLSLIFGFYILVRLLWIAHPIVFLFFLGVLFGLPLAQGADWFEKRRVPRGLAVAIILTLFFGLLTGGVMGMAPILRSQSRELQQRLPEALDKVDDWLGRRANGVFGFLLVGDSTETQRAAGSPDSATRALTVSDSARAAPAVTSSTTVTQTATTVKPPTVAVGGNLRHELTKQ